MKEVFTMATITPTEVLAADSAEFVIRLEVGPGFQSAVSRIVFDFMQRLGTSSPSIWLNEDSGYVEAYLSNPYATFRKRLWDLPKEQWMDRDHPPSGDGDRMIVLDIDGRLNVGDVIELHWGETTMGFGPGAKVTSVVPRKEHYEFINIRYFSDQERGMPDRGRAYPGYERPIPDAETAVKFQILPRPAVRLRLLRKMTKALLVPYDPFWNIAQVGNPSDLVRVSEAAVRNAGGVFEYRDKNVQIQSRGLPMTETAAMDSAFDGMNIYWGDMHTHSSYSTDVQERSRMDMTPGELMAFARDRAGLDFFAVTDHHSVGHDHVGYGRGANLIRPDHWKSTMDDIRQYHVPGEFVVFPGFEDGWPRGDTIFLMNWMPEYEEIDIKNSPDLRTIWELWKDKDYISVPHFHSPGALDFGTWWKNGRMDREPVLEILSDHGSYEREKVYEVGRAACKKFRADRCGEYFLKNGYKYGFVGHSDDHKGHVGVNALTAIFSKSLTRDAVFDAYRKRRTYATTNARIRLVFTANGQLMGSEIPDTEHKEFVIEVVGEGRLKKVELFRNGDVYRHFVPDGNSFKTALNIQEAGSSNWYVRVTQLDNHLAISSPIWFE